jgi:hypothetical protein
MTQTKYPISKIRSGEVAVKLTSLEQFKKIAPEQDNEQEAFSPNFYHVYERKQKYVPELELYWITKRECNLYTLIDFPQIDWEEKEEVIIATDADSVERINELENQLASLKAENERLKEESEKLKSENEEVYRQLKLRESSKSSQPQELSLRQRMAWEYLKENPQVGVEKSFKYIDNFLNYKGGNDEQ